MMGIDDSDVEHLADLARLNLDSDERGELTDDLNEILDFAEKIQELDTEDVEPTYHAMPIENVSGEDESRPSPDPDPVLRNAPDSSDGYFVVPKVIENQ